MVEGKEPGRLGLHEKIEVALWHIGLLVKYKGEYIGIREARKHAMWYIKGIPKRASKKSHGKGTDL